MGNQVAEPNQVSALNESNSLILNNQLIYVKKVNHEAYGEIKIFQQKSLKKLIAIKTKIFNSKQDCDKFIEKAQLRTTFEVPTVISIQDIIQASQTEFCSEFYKIQLAFDFYEKTLKNEIKERTKTKNYFTELELLHIIDCILSALISLNSQNIAHEDVQPQNIFVTEDYIYRLNDIQFMTDMTGFKKNMIGQNDTCYLSPELFSALINRKLNPVYDYQKSDVFSLGITILEAASLESIQNCYNYDKGIIIEENIKRQMFMVNKQYSEQLFELIDKMLIINPDERPNFNSMLESLQFHIQLSEYQNNNDNNLSQVINTNNNNNQQLNQLEQQQQFENNTIIQREEAQKNKGKYQDKNNISVQNNVQMNQPLKNQIQSQNKILQSQNFQKQSAQQQFPQIIINSGQNVDQQQQQYDMYKTFSPKQNQQQQQNNFQNGGQDNSIRQSIIQQQQQQEDLSEQQKQQYIIEQESQIIQNSLEDLELKFQNAMRKSEVVQQKFNVSRTPKISQENFYQKQADFYNQYSTQKKNNNLSNGQRASYQAKQNQQQQINIPQDQQFQTNTLISHSQQLSECPFQPTFNLHKRNSNLQQNSLQNQQPYDSSRLYQLYLQEYQKLMQNQ